MEVRKTGSPKGGKKKVFLAGFMDFYLILIENRIHFENARS